MPRDDLAEFRQILNLRRDQVDRVERMILDDLGDHAAVKRHCEMRAKARLAEIADDLPWRRVPGGNQIVDRSDSKKVRRVRERMLDVMDQERARIERELLPKRLRAAPLRV